jgi:hypothetical protein
MPITIDGTNGITQAGEFNSDSTFGFKNRIINGGMAIWQRGTSITTGGAYTADRWNEVSGNSNQHIQSTDAPTGFAYSMQLIGVGANQNQRIESLNCQDLSGQTVTVSFWVKNTSGTDTLIAALYYCNSADNFGSLTQIGSNVTISSNPSSTWTQYTATFSNLPAGAKNGLSLYIARLGTGSVSTTWYLTGVQLEVGSTATSFDYRPYGTELVLCQRYYQKSYDTNSAVPVVNSITGSTGGYKDRTSDTSFLSVRFKVEMRATPTVTTYDYQGTAGKMAGGSFASLTATVFQQGTSSFNVASGTGNPGVDSYVNYAAAIEL